MIASGAMSMIFLYCAALRPEGLTADSGVSYNGVHLDTVLPYTIALCGTAYWSWRAAKQLTSLHWLARSLRLMSICLVGIILTPTHWGLSLTASTRPSTRPSVRCCLSFNYSPVRIWPFLSTDAPPPLGSGSSSLARVSPLPFMSFSIMVTSSRLKSSFSSPSGFSCSIRSR